MQGRTPHGIPNFPNLANRTKTGIIDLRLKNKTINIDPIAPKINEENYDFLSRSVDLRNQTFTLGIAKREKNEFAIFSSLMRIMRFAKNYKILHNWLDSA